MKTACACCTVVCLIAQLEQGTDGFELACHSALYLLLADALQL